ncbi:S66 family peptidase [Shouchella patagoniensis]|uniref:S66 family peptidase n=1 Tax=Shouchella patagoniensis TaxID=228576 RepID=UPI000994FB62|nr:S66 peptidase family protein [Shouchella patagoniensis]
MLNLTKPQRLKQGDLVATVSLSWGGAGDPSLLWRYEQGKKRLQDVFGLEVIEMPYTLADPSYVYKHPEKRAEDLMAAFKDPSIKAIICCIGGNDSIRMLPYVDFDVIKANPKIFTGYSDNTVGHLMCLKAGLSSFYGVSVLNDFAENVAMSDYTKNWVERTFFQDGPIGTIAVSDTWTGERLEWDRKNQDIGRTFKVNHDYELIQGNKTVQGRLIGGCFDVLQFIKGTSLFPELDQFNETILFLETSEVHCPPWLLEDGLRNYGMMGILNRINGILFAKPQGEFYYEEYKSTIKKVLAEFELDTLPVLYNASFGHNEPKCLLPYGVLAEIDTHKRSFTILEAGVVS